MRKEPSLIHKHTHTKCEIVITQNVYDTFFTERSEQVNEESFYFFPVILNTCVF